MGSYDDPMIAWFNVVSQFAGAQSMSMSAEVEIGNTKGPGSRVKFREDADMRVRDAEDLAETLGLEYKTDERKYGTVVEVLE